MKKNFLPAIAGLSLLFSFSLTAQEKDPGYLGKAKLYKEKKFALEYLNKETTIEEYGKISDAIWSYAELGMQECLSLIH